MRESQLQSAVEYYLKLYENQQKLVYIKNNTGLFRNEKGGAYRVGKKGSSDFIIAVKGGVTLWIEVKLPSTKQNPNQIEFQDKIEKLSHKYYVARSLDDVVAILKKYL
jgi:hypothetical protein